MFFIIGLFGSRNRKVFAAYEFFLYTLIGSLFLLLALITLYLETGTSDYLTLLAQPISINRQYILWLGKTPLAIIHLVRSFSSLPALAVSSISKI